MIEPNALLYQLSMINTPINTLPLTIEEALLAILTHKQQLGVSSPFETVPVAEIGLIFYTPFLDGEQKRFRPYAR